MQIDDTEESHAPAWISVVLGQIMLLSQVLIQTDGADKFTITKATNISATSLYLMIDAHRHIYIYSRVHVCI